MEIQYYTCPQCGASVASASDHPCCSKCGASIPVTVKKTYSASQQQTVTTSNAVTHEQDLAAIVKDSSNKIIWRLQSIDSNINTILGWVTFFGVLAVISLIVSLILAIKSCA